MVLQFSKAQIMESIEHFQVPMDDRLDWKLCPKQRRNTSPMWDAGVMLEHKSEKRFKWYCLASDLCKMGATAYLWEQLKQAAMP